MLYACYAPLLVYESQILKESLFLFLSFLSLSLLLVARKRHFGGILVFISGAAAALPFFIRFSGLMWLGMYYLWIAGYLWKKRNLRPLLLSAFGSGAVFLTVAVYNFYNGHGIKHYFTPNTAYLLAVGSKTETTSLSIGKQPSAVGNPSLSRPFYSAYIYLSKLKYIFTAYEMPNNVNYYFVRSKFPLLRILPGPMLLVPAAVAGLIILLSGLYRDQKTAVLFFYALAFIVPMILFVPLARYKIALAPLFAIFAAWWVMHICSLIHSGRKNQLVKALLIMLCAALFSGYICRIPPERNSDIRAFGIAASYVPDKLMASGRFAEAKDILKACYQANPDNPYILLNYASSLNGTGRAAQAEEVLWNFPEGCGAALTGRCFYELAESQYMQRKYNDAFKSYSVALRYPVSKRRRELALERIRELKSMRKNLH
jgi:tetratricopeptide (TPR) repeat protein